MIFSDEQTIFIIYKWFIRKWIKQSNGGERLDVVLLFLLVFLLTLLTKSIFQFKVLAYQRILYCFFSCWPSQMSLFEKGWINMLAIFLKFISLSFLIEVSPLWECDFIFQGCSLYVKVKKWFSYLWINAIDFVQKLH